MAILKIEELNANYGALNCFGSAQDIFNENETLECHDTDDYFNERLFKNEFFKRFTLSVENAEEFNNWKDKLYNELIFLRDGLSEKKNDFRNAHSDFMSAVDGSPKEEEATKQVNKLKKEIEKLEKNFFEVRELMEEITASQWKENKTPKGQKIGKYLKRMGVRQSFLDWSSTQEKSDKIVQITINPTVQAVAGMSNYARSNSWNGHNGTSCQDTRHSESYTKHLIGAISDDKLYSIQLNYLDDNLALDSHISEEMAEGKSLNEAIESYDINNDLENDILSDREFQDKLRARVLGRVWEVHKQDYREANTSELEQSLLDIRNTGLEMNIMKAIQYYGSDKTRAELKDGLKQMSEVINLIP